LNAKEFLNGLLYRRSEIDDWLSGRSFPFSRYDPDLGFLHRDRRCRDGIGGSESTYTYDRRTGARRTINHAEEPCRINTYGDSYTSCEQGNDGETWQEVLAARLGEPIRNFGVGSYSVYQTYLRMKREEASVPAEYVIINIYDDDLFRNLVGWQRIRVRWWGTQHPGPPQPYVKANPATKEFTEFRNPCREPEDLYDFCDLDRVYERFRDDFLVRIMLAKTNAQHGTPAESYRDIEELAEEYGVRTTIRTSKKLLEIANLLYARSAVYASMRVVEKIGEFASSQGKEVLYVASYSTSSVGDRISPGHGPKVPEMRRPGNSFQESFVRFMLKKGGRYVDLMDAHLKDFSTRKVGVTGYLGEYYVVPKECTTHYSPLGNRFTAFAVKDRLVEMLDPKPPSYLRAGTSDGWDTCVSLDHASG
jgi:hypothetical protein